MKNITLSVDEETLRKVRLYAAERNTSVNAIVREKLAELVASKTRVEDALKSMESIAEQSGMEVGPITWSRDETHER